MLHMQVIDLDRLIEMERLGNAVVVVVSLVSYACLDSASDPALFRHISVSETYVPLKEHK